MTYSIFHDSIYHIASDIRYSESQARVSPTGRLGISSSDFRRSRRDSVRVRSQAPGRPAAAACPATVAVVTRSHETETESESESCGRGVTVTSEERLVLLG
jgi:hypothetical protein